jgi:RNA methyltransferase, TrmH family
MISKSRAKFIIALQKKKAREEKGLFVIEGDKLVREFLIARYPVLLLLAKKEFIKSLTAEMNESVAEVEDVTYEELKQVSSLKTPHNALAVVKMLSRRLQMEELSDRLTVALDGIQDPGNMGTIMRAAAWFGIENIVCSYDCVDEYNSKVIQAGMGAILHVKVFHTDLKEFLSDALRKKLSVYGTMLNGDTIYNQELDKKGIILLGNESKGISGELIPCITHKITIPGIKKGLPGIESLNVSMAASIVFSEFLRRSGSLPD